MKIVKIIWVGALILISPIFIIFLSISFFSLNDTIILNIDARKINYNIQNKKYNYMCIGDSYKSSGVSFFKDSIHIGGHKFTYRDTRALMSGDNIYYIIFTDDLKKVADFRNTTPEKSPDLFKTYKHNFCEKI